MITTHTAETLIAFEARIRDHFAAGEIPCLIHLSGGNENQLLEIFQDIRPEDWVFSTHRNHTHALLKGIPEPKLEADILAGKSMFIYSSEHNFLTSSILAGTCCIAAGVAYDIRREFLRTAPPYTPLTKAPERREPHVFCFLGDGAEEQGHFAEAVAFVAGHDLPCTFIIEDNDRQVDTNKRDRRGYFHADWKRNIIWPPCVRRYHYVPTYPHGGAGLPRGTVTFKPEAIARLKAAA